MTKLDIFNTSFLNDFTKGAVGFDDIFTKMNDFQKNIAKLPTYPPYNIKKTGENTYVIEMAVAGFGKQDIELVLEDGVLTIKGSVSTDDTSSYVFKGIADRAFTRKFTLADTVEVKNADLINGMLKIFLERFIPESKKPKIIPINNTEPRSDIAIEAEQSLFDDKNSK